MKVVLMGYMGSGKSTVGSNLAEKLSYKFIDLDHFIENKEGKTIKQIFSDSGAIYFRKLETTVLKEVLDSTENIVLALGGGTPCYGNNLDIIKSSNSVTSIYLSGTIPYLSERLFRERHKRPLIAEINEKEALMEFIGKHLFERSQYYFQADYKVDIDQKSVDDLISEISLLLF
ncbi:shikimate kinase [Flavobacteriaceae bacterium MAR_2010_188]|nr:shikimate kinase [Flavobacteriaceae bacterium MAR_2010_188]